MRRTKWYFYLVKRDWFLKWAKWILKNILAPPISFCNGKTEKWFSSAPKIFLLFSLGKAHICIHPSQEQKTVNTGGPGSVTWWTPTALDGSHWLKWDPLGFRHLTGQSLTESASKAPNTTSDADVNVALHELRWFALLKVLNRYYSFFYWLTFAFEKCHIYSALIYYYLESQKQNYTSNVFSELGQASCELQRCL